MGIAKCIMGLGTTDIYNSNCGEFIKELSRRFAVNLMVSVYDDEPTNITMAAAGKYDFGYTNTYELEIDQVEYDLDDTQPKNYFPAYTLYIPVAMLHNDVLEFHFLPNRVVSISFLNFESTWHVFISNLRKEEKIIMGYHPPFEAVVQDMRKIYIPLLKKAGCYSIVIYTDAHYKFEETTIFTFKKGCTYTLDAIIKMATQLDRLNWFNFSDILNETSAVNLPACFLTLPELKIGLTDNFI